MSLFRSSQKEGLIEIMAEMILTFEWDGHTVKKETKGFVGSGCITKTKFIEDALGTAKNRKKKAEYYESKEKENENERKLKN